MEIPYIPRIAEPSRRRLRFRRSRWLVLGWSAIFILLVAIVVGGVSRLLVHRSRIAQLQAVKRLTESAARQREAGAYGLALIDLDAAIELLRSMDQIDSHPDLADLRRTREETARQDAEKVLADLTRRDDLPPTAGAWLNLRARISKDSDLAAFREKVEAAFQAQLKSYLESEYRIASSSLESRKFERSLESCLRLDRVLKFLPPDLRNDWQNRLEEVAAAIVRKAGVVATESKGQFIDGSKHKSYSPKLLLTATKALREKGYIPPPPGVSWRTLWSQAPYRLNLEVAERREGNYQATQNRLTRIEVHLTLSCRDSLLWESTSIARSRVPSVHVPASISKRLAISRERIDEFEDLLYADAESLIDSHLAITVKDLPRCPINSPDVPSVPSPIPG